jgi:hypothetical protein
MLSDLRIFFSGTQLCHPERSEGPPANLSLSTRFPGFRDVMIENHVMVENHAIAIKFRRAAGGPSLLSG